MLEPNGGEQYFETLYMEWTSSGTSGFVNIYLSRNGGAHWTTVAANTADDGDHFSPGWGAYQDYRQCLVRIEDASNSSVADVSDDFFTMLNTISYPLYIEIVGPSSINELSTADYICYVHRADYSSDQCCSRYYQQRFRRKQIHNRCFYTEFWHEPG